MAVGVPTPGTRAEWLRYEGRHAAVAAPPGSFAASRAPHVLEEAERTVLALQRLLEVPARQDTVRVDIVLVDAAPAPGRAPGDRRHGAAGAHARIPGAGRPRGQPRGLVRAAGPADGARARGPVVRRGRLGGDTVSAGSPAWPPRARGERAGAHGRRHAGSGPACRRHPPLAVHRAGGRPAAGAADHRVRRAGPDPRAPAPVGRPARLPPRGPRGGRRAARRTSARGLVRRRPRRRAPDLVLDEGRVSREHAVITTEDGRVAVRDAGSRNGTRLNDEPVTEAELHDGDRLTIGRWDSSSCASTPPARAPPGPRRPRRRRRPSGRAPTSR